MNEVAQENQQKITNPARINRLLERICQASLPVLLRTVDGAKPVAIRGRASNFSGVEAPQGMRISNISEQGMHVLRDKRNIRVEFVGMSTHVAFDSMISVREGSSIFLAIPTLILNIERRKNARFITTPENSSFVRLSVWGAQDQDVTAPPQQDPYTDQASWLALADLSEGGVCITTRFPSVVNFLRAGIIDDGAKLILPMQSPIKVRLEVRWIRRIKEMVNIEGSQRCLRTFRVGVQFVGLSPEQNTLLRQYMQQLTTAGAV